LLEYTSYVLVKIFYTDIKRSSDGDGGGESSASLRAGLVHMLTSGVYSYLPWGLSALPGEKIIREEMDAIGCHELLMPALHPIDIWKKTGR